MFLPPPPPQSSLDEGGGQDQEAVKVTEDHKKEMDQLMSHVAKQSSAIVELKVCGWMGVVGGGV